MYILYLLYSLFFPYYVDSSWSQQYGDPQSTSFSSFRGPYKIGWSYTTPPFPSQASPCITDDGIMYYALRADVVAIAPNGTVIGHYGIAPDGNTYLTNLVYSSKYNVVVVGAMWSSYDVVAIDHQSHNIKWKVTHNELVLTTTISLSDEVGAVYLGGQEEQVLVALHLTNGSLFLKMFFVEVGLFMQTKIGTIPQANKQKPSQEILLIPTLPANESGILIGYSVSKPILNKWQISISYSLGALFAFSMDGIIFGGAGSQQMFIVDGVKGSLLYSGGEYCRDISGPAVDLKGFGYFSCGNQVISVYQNGKLRWKSDPIGEPGPNSITSPSIHPRENTIYFIHNSQTNVYALNSEDGSLRKSYSVPRLGYLEPPLIVESGFMYLIGFNGSSISIYPELL